MELKIVKKEFEKMQAEKPVEKVNQINNDEKMKLKDEEIKRLIFTRKLSVHNGIKLHEKIQKLESEIIGLKNNKTPSSLNTNLPFPCDKCESTFKTAGLLIGHVKSDHKKLPYKRP